LGRTAPEPLFRGKGLCFIYADSRQVSEGRVLLFPIWLCCHITDTVIMFQVSFVGP
jgi:hypothetical protein